MNLEEEDEDCAADELFMLPNAELLRNIMSYLMLGKSYMGLCGRPGLHLFLPDMYRAYPGDP